MITHVVFIECCGHTRNSQLIYVLVQLAKGARFVFRDVEARADDAAIHLTINGSQMRYVYTDMDVRSICDDVRNLFALDADPAPADDLAAAVFRDHAVRDAIVCAVRSGTVRGTGSAMYGRIVARHMLRMEPAGKLTAGELVDIYIAERAAA